MSLGRASGLVEAALGGRDSFLCSALPIGDLGCREQRCYTNMFSGKIDTLSERGVVYENLWDGSPTGWQDG